VKESTTKEAVMVQHVKNIVRIFTGDFKHIFFNPVATTLIALRLTLLVYISLSLLVGIVLRKKVLELNEFFEEKLSQTGIM
jgi:hypothetical protein